MIIALNASNPSNYLPDHFITATNTDVDTLYQ